MARARPPLPGEVVLVGIVPVVVCRARGVVLRGERGEHGDRRVLVSKRPVGGDLPVAGLVQVGDEILLARNAAWPPKTFALITGFLEAGETPEAGIAREVKEETDLDAERVELIGVYEFTRKNEVIMAYHVPARGTVRLSEELVEYRMLAPHRLRPWRAGTGLAVADWMRARGLPVEFVDLPPRPVASPTP